MHLTGFKRVFMAPPPRTTKIIMNGRKGGGEKVEKLRHQFAATKNLFVFVVCIYRSAILGEVQAQGSTKLPSNKSLLVLGDNASGKTTLIAKLQGVEDPKKGAGLEYAYIDVRDEYRDGKLWCHL